MRRGNEAAAGQQGGFFRLKSAPVYSSSIICQDLISPFTVIVCSRWRARTRTACKSGKVKDMRRLGPGLVAALLLVACRPSPPAREYRLVGQVLAVDRATSRVTIRHQDIEHFMPGMTMPFPVKDASAARRPCARQSRRRDAGRYKEPTSGSHASTSRAPRRCPRSPRRWGWRLATNCRTRRSSIRTARAFRLPACTARRSLPSFTPAARCRSSVQPLKRSLSTLQRALRHEPGLAGVRLLAITIDPGARHAVRAQSACGIS